MRAVIEGVRTALLAVVVYLVALPFLLFAGFGAVIFFLCTAYILGREYFELAAMRYRPVAEAKAMRKAHQGTVFVAGLFIAAFVSIPIVNLATPLFGMAFMVHMHKRLSGARTTLLEPVRRGQARGGLVDGLACRRGSNIVACNRMPMRHKREGHHGTSGGHVPGPEGCGRLRQALFRAPRPAGEENSQASANTRSAAARRDTRRAPPPFT